MTGGLRSALLVITPLLIGAPCPSAAHTDQLSILLVPIASTKTSELAAPEGNEPGGAQATQAMRAMVQGRELRCELDGERTHDRCVGICYLNGQDISELMVRRGLARDCPRFSRGRYAEAERHAAADGATIGQAYPLPGYCRPRR